MKSILRSARRQRCHSYRKAFCQNELVRENATKSVYLAQSELWEIDFIKPTQGRLAVWRNKAIAARSVTLAKQSQIDVAEQSQIAASRQAGGLPPGFRVRANRNRLLPISTSLYVPKSGRPDFGWRAAA
jgi:hypothetical protein